MQENDKKFSLYERTVIFLKKFCYSLDSFLIWLSATIISLTLFSFVLYVIGFNFVLILWIDLLPFEWVASRLLVLLISGALRFIFSFRIFSMIADNFKLKYLIYGLVVGLILFVSNIAYYKYISFLDNIKDESYTGGLEEGFNNGYYEAKDEFYYSRHNEGYNDGYDKGLEIGYSNALVENRGSNIDSYNNGYEAGKKKGYSQVKERVIIKEVENDNGYAEKSTEDSNLTDTFTIGDSKEKVKRIMGTPTDVAVYNGLGQEVWNYDSSRITFENGLVKEYSNNGELKIE